VSILVAPLEALTDSLLSDPERRVLLALFSYRGKVTELVFPSLDALSERSNINDKTRISKITTSLAKKGWLTKKKKGFTGCNQYTMCMPERLTNLDSDAKYDVGLRDQVQVTNQITNHINKPIKSSASSFIKPDLNDVSEYMTEYGNQETLYVHKYLPDEFIDYYEDKNWKRGKTQMKDWKATARSWVRKENANQPKQLTEAQVNKNRRRNITANVLDIENTNW
jgi:hypothetical protein